MPKSLKTPSFDEALNAAFAELKRQIRRPGADKVEIGNQLCRLYAVRDEMALLNEISISPLGSLLRCGGSLTFPHLGVVLAGDPNAVERHASVNLSLTVTNLDGGDYFANTGAASDYVMKETSMRDCIKNIKAEAVARDVFVQQNVTA